MENSNYYNVGISNDPSDWVFSNSSLSEINPNQGGHPVKLVRFFSEESEEQKSYSLERGTLLHKYMENPEGFAISTVPKPSDKLAIAADNLIADLLTATDTVEITDAMILANVRNVGWNSKWGDEAILKNTKDQIKAYAEEVLANRNKHILSENTAKVINSCITAINENELITNLLKPGEDDEVYTEFPIYFQIFSSYNAKAKLDRIHVNPKAKVINHFDYKTTGGNVSKFEDSFESYRYYRQFAFYDCALREFFGDGYVINHYVIVVETTEPFATAVYPVTDFWLDEGMLEIKCLFNILDMHFANDNFKQTYIEQQNYGYSKFHNIRNRESRW